MDGFSFRDPKGEGVRIFARYCAISTARGMIVTRGRKRSRRGRREREKERENAHYRSVFAQRYPSPFPPPSPSSLPRNNTTRSYPKNQLNGSWCHPRWKPSGWTTVSFSPLLCVSMARCKLHHHLVSIQHGKPTHLPLGWSSCVDIIVMTNIFSYLRY